EGAPRRPGGCRRHQQPREAHSRRRASVHLRALPASKALREIGNRESRPRPLYRKADRALGPRHARRVLCRRQDDLLDASATPCPPPGAAITASGGTRVGFVSEGIRAAGPGPSPGVDPAARVPSCSAATGDRLQAGFEDTAWRPAEIPYESQALQQAQEVVGHVDLPPAKALIGRALVVVMVVVPTLTGRHQGEQPTVARTVGGGVATAAEQMAERVDRERPMPKEHRRKEVSPHESLPAADQEEREREGDGRKDIDARAIQELKLGKCPQV